MVENVRFSDRMVGDHKITRPSTESTKAPRVDVKQLSALNPSGPNTDACQEVPSEEMLPMSRKQ
eukprot:3386422-Amphidinium_carterae.1